MWDPLPNLHITDARDMQVSDNAQCELNYVFDIVDNAYFREIDLQLGISDILNIKHLKFSSVTFSVEYLNINVNTSQNVF